MNEYKRLQLNEWMNESNNNKCVYMLVLKSASYLIYNNRMRIVNQYRKGI